MKDIVSVIDGWLESGEEVALATVIETWGSAPRGEGAKMAITQTGQMAGSVSGGCVEGAVVEAGSQVLRTGQARLLKFGVADEDAWEVGLACGGQISIFVNPLDLKIYQAMREALLTNRPFTHLTVISGQPGVVGKEVLVFENGEGVATSPALYQASAKLAAHFGLQERPARPHAMLGPELVVLDGLEDLAGSQLFLEAIPPAPKLVVVGGVHIAVPLVGMAAELGYETIVIDPRRAFATSARFGHADRLLSKWPQEAFQEVEINTATAVVMLTHDPKIDDPALEIVLPGPAFFVGALGSKKTQRARRQRLREAGLDDQLIDRIQGPVGLNLGGREPQEIALAIMAQITAARYDRLGMVEPAA